MSFLRDLSARHTELKRRIHAFKVPIRDPRLLLLVKACYFCLPVVAGYQVMLLTNSMRRASLGENGEVLLEKMRRERAARSSRAPAPAGADAAAAMGGAEGAGARIGVGTGTGSGAGTGAGAAALALLPLSLTLARRRRG
jgi:hypothetical protein